MGRVSRHCAGPLIIVQGDFRTKSLHVLMSACLPNKLMGVAWRTPFRQTISRCRPRNLFNTMFKASLSANLNIGGVFWPYGRRELVQKSLECRGKQHGLFPRDCTDGRTDFD